MTDLEWNQYVEKIARRIFIPECIDLKRTNSVFIKQAFKFKTSAKPRLKKIQNIEHRAISKPKIKVAQQISYITKTYLYEGRTYTRKFVGVLNAK